MKKYVLFIIFIIIPLQAFSQFQQYIQEPVKPTSHTRAGGAFTLLESGTGFGAFYEIPFEGFWHMGANLNLYLLRDSKQYDYYHPYYGYVTNRQNNVYLVDVMFSLRKRLFPYDIDNGFQPFAGIGIGGAYGANFPENDLVPDQYEWAVTGNLELGVNIVYDTYYLFGLSVFFRQMNFSGKLGEKQNHSSIGIRVEIGKSLK